MLDEQELKRRLAIAYIAGLFDGEGNVMCKQYMRRRRDREKIYPTWYIRIEVSMTDQEAINYLQDTLEFGWSGPKRFHKNNVKKNGEPIKPQWRWCCGYRDALKFAKLMMPHAKTKRKDLKRIIKHYA